MDQTEFQSFCLVSSNEQACIQKFQQVRWPNGFRCPHCGGSDAYEIRTRRLPLYECKTCGVQTSLTAGTILEGSRTPIRLWLLALYLHAAPKGISAVRLASIIGTTYKTAWLICHKIRHAMSQVDKNNLLNGLVRINFAQYGRPYNPTVAQGLSPFPMLMQMSSSASVITYPELIRKPNILPKLRAQYDTLLRNAS